MSDLISRSALWEAIHNAGCCGAAKGTWDDGYDNGISVAIDIVENAPTVDAVPVVHGRWIMTLYATTSKRGRVISNKKFACSECGYSNGRKQSNYCPNCGAKMDGERKDDE